MTSKRIRELDHETIQQIAAGEVINDPAAIVKETVENSLDAESSEIVLEIRGGGKDYIRISDNGFGISRADIPLAFKRHSTSKLFTAEDLYNISSFGFRGEALASIIAVSKLELFTKTKEEKGSQAIIENGEIKEIKDSVCPNGTSLIIRDIFYNFPVRKNFLKNASVEGNKVTDTITRLALGNPSVSFKYVKDRKVIFKSPGSGELLQAIHSILGRDFSQNLLKVDYKSEKLSIKGYVSSKNFYRSNRNHQYLYVNNRYVFNKEIRNKIEAIYRSIIPNGRFPVYVLFIDIDPAMVDVNIHPTKEEVNFTDIKLINNGILTAIDPVVKESLEVEDLGQTIRQEEKKEEKKTHEPVKLYEKNIEEQSFLSLDKLYELSLDELEETVGEEVGKARDVDKDKFVEELVDNGLVEKELSEDQAKLKPGMDNKETQIENLNFSEAYRDEETREDRTIKEKSSKTKKVESDSEKNKFKKFINNINIIGSVFQTYLIAEDKLNEDLVLIDQHAAHERIMYEKIIKDFEKEAIHSQVLMTPELVQLTNNELSVFKDNEDFFKNIGFDVEGFGDNTVIIRKVPIIFGKPEIKKLFFEILDNLAYNNSDIDNFYELRLDKISKLACTYAVKSGDKLYDMETDRLLKDLGETEIPFTCPHGRPTVLKLNKKDVEKLFKRIL